MTGLSHIKSSDMNLIHTIDELEDELSRPTQGVLEGDMTVLGAGGKMGPMLARMVHRGLDQIGQKQRRVIAVSRFSSASAVQSLQRQGGATLSKPTHFKTTDGRF